VAVGVEREDQREALTELGCELGQGHLLGSAAALGGLRREAR
jgi:EAL domain-containing protein (putative c-di-GMP-specific phosphodiesterase class I)